MQEDDFRFPFGNYFKPSKLIEGVRLTDREIDVIACLLQGRSQKKIASLLSIVPRTVETHIRNIFLKLEKNSREEIIDFIENAGKVSDLREHYRHLLIQAQFEKHLKLIAALIKGKGFECCLIHVKDQNDKSLFFEKLEEHFKKVSVNIVKEEIEENLIIAGSILDEKFLKQEIILYLSSRTMAISFIEWHKEHNITENLARFVFLLSKQENFLETFLESGIINHINFYENYYFAFFDLLKIIYKNISLDNIIFSFKQRYDLLQYDFSQEHLIQNEAPNKNVEQYSSTKNIVSIQERCSIWASRLTVIASMLTIFTVLISPIF